jgi:CDP-diacylglycerol--glycerol-3-phosphate 3-phosphatidyltransferase
MKINFPTFLTLLRIAVIPVIILFFYSGLEWSRYIASLLFGAASITDILDGYLARKWKQESKMGAFLDPVADKLIVMVMVVLLIQAYPTWMMVVSGIVIIGREIIISSLREWMAEIGKRDAVAVSQVGKFKTFAQIVALGFLMFEYSWLGIPTFEIGATALFIAVILSVYSMVLYLNSAIKAINS